MPIDIQSAIKKLSERRTVFTSEADFQLEFGWILREMYPQAKVRMEYCPNFDPNMHIDILLIIDNKWIPIELKYKTKGCTKIVDGDTYILKNHSAKDVNCYLYLKDIMRIEEIRSKQPSFSEGFTIMITNEPSYLEKPTKPDCVYAAFSIEQNTVKTGIMDWGVHASVGTKKGCEKPITLSGVYPIQWKLYSQLDTSSTGTLYYLVNHIEKQEE